MEDEALMLVEVDNGVVTKEALESFLNRTQMAVHAVYSQELITSIDLSARDILNLDDNVTLPINLVKLDLSFNEFIEVPSVVTESKKLQILNMSHNKIKLFDDCPQFCHTLVQLDLSYNDLQGPPKWIFIRSPEKLEYLKLSYNSNMGKLLNNDYSYMQDLLDHPTVVKDLEIEYCRLSCVNLAILAAFPKVKALTIGSTEHRQWANAVAQLPLVGLDKCRKLEKLNVAFTHVYTIHANITIYKHLKEINLSRNKLELIPDEFCNLEHLEICILSFNEIVALPRDIGKLQKLVRLHVDNNALVRVPDMLCQLPNLKALDIYNNDFKVAPAHFSHLEELDLAQNYFDEPDDVRYLEQKSVARLAHDDRADGRRLRPDEEISSDEDNIEDDKREDTVEDDKREDTVEDDKREDTVEDDKHEDDVDDDKREDTVDNDKGDDNTCKDSVDYDTVEENKREEPVDEGKREDAAVDDAPKRNLRQFDLFGSDKEWDPTKPVPAARIRAAPRPVLRAPFPELGAIRKLPPLPPYTGLTTRGRGLPNAAFPAQPRNQRILPLMRAEMEGQFDDLSGNES